MSECKPMATPMDVNTRLTETQPEITKEEEEALTEILTQMLIMPGI